MKSVICRLAGPPPKTTQDITETKDAPNPRIEVKIPDPAGNRNRRQGFYRPLYGDGLLKKFYKVNNN